MFYQLARKLLRYQYFLLSLVAIVFVLVGILARLGIDLVPDPPLCEALPAYRAEVPARVRADIDGLFAAGLLYCGEPDAGLASVEPRIYWGSDGTRSVVFFQARPGMTLAQVGVPDYAFNVEFVPGPAGDEPMPGYRAERFGIPAWLNEAEESPPGYYYRVDGAPAPSDASVRVTVQGPAAEQEGLSGRDFMRDLELAWAYIRGEVREEGRTVKRPLTMPILPERWEATRNRQVNPALANAQGLHEVQIVAGADLPEPALFQTVHGASGSSVWVAGIVTGTTPALVLVPRAGDAAAPIEPRAVSTWSSRVGPNRLALFAFDALPPGAYDARYWNDGRRRDETPPDQIWPAAFLPKPPEVTPSAEP